MRQATFREASRILTEDSESILRQIPAAPIQLGLPVDGAGVRVQVSVEPDQLKFVPTKVLAVVDGDAIEIPLEPMGNYEEMKAL
jgi:hypothetical protein